MLFDNSVPTGLFEQCGVNFLSTHILSLWDYPVRDNMWVEIKKTPN